MASQAERGPHHLEETSRYSRALIGITTSYQFKSFEPVVDTERKDPTLSEPAHLILPYGSSALLSYMDGQSDTGLRHLLFRFYREGRKAFSGASGIAVIVGDSVVRNESKSGVFIAKESALFIPVAAYNGTPLHRQFRGFLFNVDFTSSP